MPTPIHPMLFIWFPPVCPPLYKTRTGPVGPVRALHGLLSGPGVCAAGSLAAGGAAIGCAARPAGGGIPCAAVGLVSIPRAAGPAVAAGGTATVAAVVLVVAAVIAVTVVIAVVGFWVCLFVCLFVSSGLGNCDKC